MIRPQASKPGSGSRFRGSFGRQKPSFLENFRTTLSGPQHLPIAKNEEAKRHDRGTLPQNEAFVACPALRANNAFTPLRSVRSAKNYNSPASSSAVRPSTKKRHAAGRELADEFEASLTATLFKMTVLNRFPMIIVCHNKERRRWFEPSKMIQ